MSGTPIHDQLERTAQELDMGRRHRGWANKPAELAVPVAEAEPVAEPVYRCSHCKDLQRVAIEVAPHRYTTIWCPHCAADRAEAQVARETGLVGAVKNWRLANFRRRFGPATMGLDAAREAVKRPVGFVTFHGGYGSGKSHLLGGICNDLHEAGRSVHYTTLAGLLDYLREAFDPDSTTGLAARYERMLAVECLAIDEVEKVSVTQWADEKLFQLIDDRYRRANECLTVLASNHRICDRDADGNIVRTYPVLPSSKFVGAIMSRLLDGRFLVVDVGNEDVRPSLDRGRWLQGLGRD